MIALERTAAVLLAAGYSMRFGDSNKLLASLRAKPVAAHAAGLLSRLPLLAKFAVIQAADEDDTLADLFIADGFALIDNPCAEQGQDSSVRIGMARALDEDADAVLIFLADMPNVTEDHLHALAEAADPARAAISSNGAHRSPPALIPRKIATAILADPSRSVRSMIEPAVDVIASDRLLADIDTKADLALTGARS